MIVTPCCKGRIIDLWIIEHDGVATWVTVAQDRVYIADGAVDTGAIAALIDGATFR